MTFEYSLVAGVNDTKEDAEELTQADPWNELSCESDTWSTRSKSGIISSRIIRQQRQFKIELEKNGINVTIRREMGRDIDGACGQLRNEIYRRSRRNMECIRFRYQI